MDSFEILLDPLAEAEAEAAADYYEEQAEGLGLAWLDELERAFEQIRQVPHACPEVRRGLRRKVLIRFP